MPFVWQLGHLDYKQDSVVHCPTVDYCILSKRKSNQIESKKVAGCGKYVLASTANSVSGCGNIGIMWHTHYKNLLTSSLVCTNKNNVLT